MMSQWQIYIYISVNFIIFLVKHYYPFSPKNLFSFVSPFITTECRKCLVKLEPGKSSDFLRLGRVA